MLEPISFIKKTKSFVNLITGLGKNYFTKILFKIFHKISAFSLFESTY